MSFLKQVRELWDHLRGKGPAAAVALTLDLAEARDNKPYYLEAGAIFVEKCDGDLYARVNGPNGDGINFRYVKKILYPVQSLYLTNSAQAGKSARLLLLPTGMDADPPAAEGAIQAAVAKGTTDITTTSTTYVDVPKMEITLTTASSKLHIVFVMAVEAGSGGAFNIGIEVDGALVRDVLDHPGGCYHNVAACVTLETVGSGSHTIKGKWRTLFGQTLANTPSGAVQRQGSSRTLTVVELKQ